MVYPKGKPLWGSEEKIVRKTHRFPCRGWVITAYLSLGNFITQRLSAWALDQSWVFYCFLPVWLWICHPNSQCLSFYISKMGLLIVINTELIWELTAVMIIISIVEMYFNNYLHYLCNILRTSLPNNFKDSLPFIP